jgi:hypothetical protein
VSNQLAIAVLFQWRILLAVRIARSIWSHRWGSAVKIFLDGVGRTFARVSAEEHIANYRAARALIGKGNSERVRERGSSAKKTGTKKSAVKKAKPKEVTPARAFSERSRRRWGQPWNLAQFFSAVSNSFAAPENDRNETLELTSIPSHFATLS